MPSAKNTPEDFNPVYSPEDDDTNSVVSECSESTTTTFDDPTRKRERRHLYYSSNFMGCAIRNALTGTAQPEKVGTKQSLRYFRVTDSSGTCNSSGQRQRRDEELNREPNHLYYNGPQEALAHGWIISPEIADTWHTQHALLFPNGTLDEGVYAKRFPGLERVPGRGRLADYGHISYHERNCRTRLGLEECTCDC